VEYPHFPSWNSSSVWTTQICDGSPGDRQDIETALELARPRVNSPGPRQVVRLEEQQRVAAAALLPPGGAYPVLLVVRRVHHHQPGAYTRPLFGSTKALSVGQGVLFRGCRGGVQEVSGGIEEYEGVFRVYFVSEMAHVELESGRV